MVRAERRHTVGDSRRVGARKDGNVRIEQACIDRDGEIAFLVIGHCQYAQALRVTQACHQQIARQAGVSGKCGIIGHEVFEMQFFDSLLILVQNDKIEPQKIEGATNQAAGFAATTHQVKRCPDMRHATCEA